MIGTIEEGEMTGDLALITSLDNVKKLSSKEFISGQSESVWRKN